ncbi:MAG: EcsC family protein, partial [Gammaproteobacteria bacterium]
MARTSSTRSTAGTGKAKGRRPATVRISDKDRSALALACDRLEHPSLAARLTALIGRPVEEGLKLLPRRWYGRIHDSAEATISRALSVAIRTLPENDRTAREDLHKLLCIGSGAVGGFFGLPGTLAELPLTTTLMMRSIADIARDEGEDLALVEGRMACVEVFAYGGRPAEDDAAETGYYGLRLAMA